MPLVPDVPVEADVVADALRGVRADARLADVRPADVRRTMELNERLRREAAVLEGMVEAQGRELLALQAARARERRLAAVGQLAAGVLHDVNNALNPILAAAFLLQRRADDPAAVRDYAARITKAAETCAASAARVGRFIRQEPAAEGRDVGVDLSTLADEVVAMSRAAWTEGLQAKQVVLERQLGEGVTARGLPGEIREALLNVVQNAIDAMPQGGRVTVATGVTPPAGAGRAAAAEPAAWVTVHDTGTGMSDDVRDRAFEPFFTTKGSAGSGLGLAEVSGIMKRHRGRAEIESAPGRGTTVRLVFPFAAPSAPPVVRVDAPPPAPRRVLLVEDDGEGRELLRALLASEGHAVDAVADVHAARARLDVSAAGGEAAGGEADGGPPYDVLITDIGFPDGNGWDLVHVVRARWPRLRIAIATGWEPQRSEGDAAADLVLRKPVRAEELLTFVALAASTTTAAPTPPV